MTRRGSIVYYMAAWACGCLFMSVAVWLPGVLALVLVAPQALPAYEHPLDSHSVREAYFLGNRKDDKTAKFLAQYVKRLPLPKTGPHVAEIELRTPYAQVVLRAFQAPGSYSAQQAAQDYAARPDLVLVRVRFNLTPSYPAYLLDSARDKGGIQLRPPDFWRNFKIEVMQGHSIAPKKVSGRPIYASGLGGAEVLLEFDTGQLTSAPVRIEVFTPDGQTIEAEFDLHDLR